MRFVIVGAGAVGGVIGGRLIGSGAEVVLVARGAHADAIDRSGLIVEAPNGRRVYRPAALWRPGDGELRRGDVVLLAVKSQDTPSALAALRGDMGEGVTVACMQNGVVNEELALQRFTSVYGVLVWTPAVHLEPGIVLSYAERDALLRIGCWPQGEDDQARAIASALASAGLDADVVPDIVRWKRAKLLGNLANALDAFVTPGGRAALHRALVREGIAVFEAAGMAYMPPEQFTRFATARLPEVQLAGRDRLGGSTWQSLARGVRTTEVPYLNGYIAELGGALRVPTPYNRALVELAAEFERSERAPRTVSVDELTTRVKAGI